MIILQWLHINLTLVPLLGNRKLLSKSLVMTTLAKMSCNSFLVCLYISFAIHFQTYTVKPSQSMYSLLYLNGCISSIHKILYFFPDSGVINNVSYYVGPFLTYLGDCGVTLPTPLHTRHGDYLPPKTILNHTGKKPLV